MIMQLIDIGQKEITFDGSSYEYNGEILDGDKATGNGSFTDWLGRKFTCHFVNDMAEGACRSKHLINPFLILFEYRRGDPRWWRQMGRRDARERTLRQVFLSRWIFWLLDQLDLREWLGRIIYKCR